MNLQLNTHFPFTRVIEYSYTKSSDVCVGDLKADPFEGHLYV